MSSSEDDFLPLAQLKKKNASSTNVSNGSSSSLKRSASNDDSDFEENKPSIKKQQTSIDSDSDSDSIPLVQLKKKVKKETKVSSIKQKASPPSRTTVSENVTKNKKKKIKNEEKNNNNNNNKSKKKKKTKINNKSSMNSNHSKKKNTTSKSSNGSSTQVRKLKVHSKAERLDMAIKAYRWWKAEELPEGIQWRTLEHNGVMFPPSYEPHHVPLLYNGKEIKLNPIQEEMASFYASIPLDGPQLGNPKTAKIFNQNFFMDFKKSFTLKNNTPSEIQKFEFCDFSQIKKHLDLLREQKKNLTKEEKIPEKKKKEKEQFENGFAIVDGHLEKIGNFRIEPPGLFRGRGEHPKTGTLKERVLPEEITINCGISDRVPICNVPGHAWKEIIHRDTVSWLAYWNENVMGGIKYVWLAASSSFKGKADMEKYEKARRLKKCIDKIRKDYTKGLKAKDMFTRQRSTAMWVIDVLALRVGNEKGEDEADTVGCCSLRVEHVSFQDIKCTLTLSFLGKDSMPYNNTVELEKYGNVGQLVYENLKSFCRKKDKNAEVFDELSVTELNKHLSSLMPGLTAKVFRTFNASVTLEKELPSCCLENSNPNEKMIMDAAPKVVAYNDANRKVAILCNHQRTVPKSFDTTLEKMNAQLDQFKKQLKELKEMDTLLQKGKTKQIRLKKEEENLKKEQQQQQEEAEAEEDPIHLMLKKKEQAHLFQRLPTQDQIQKKIENWKKKIKGLALKLQDKNDNKEVALGTSKINYMDPRITVAWCKRNEVPISAVFAKALREKFVWAMDVQPDWKF